MLYGNFECTFVHNKQLPRVDSFLAQQRSELLNSASKFKIGYFASNFKQMVDEAVHRLCV